ncbi:MULTISPECIES: DUF4430 domain-containing protein [unclassified Abiotrophia]|jgi:hypothetical protein|uniref:DUF4430 domain-containing protein n=1 Tax=unclassified Abiotrophia TaxID=2608917 RepID=UPI0008A2E26C|nr:MULTISPECIES: DUF4430 domain-containing protein [unclassified Abiotrophia]MBF0942087.1 DUF4430 domain-containing protein [Abiotrophia sp.]OFS29097.1 hypothetical protein HMPREF3093_05495 [Abiotrophia sp. HMSC24B09]
MKNKRLALVLAAIVFLIAIIIALWAILSGVLKGNQPSPQVSGSNIAQVVSSSESSSSVASSSSASTSSESQSSESKASGEEKSTTVTFKFYVHGEIIGSFDVPNAAGKTVFEAMKSNKEIRFNYNEEEQVIDNFFDNVNDGENTWVYLLNGQVADHGAKTQVLKAGDSIDWYFGTIDEIPTSIIPASDAEAE